MGIDEKITAYPNFSSERGFGIRIYESVVSFRRRDFFEHKHSDFEISLILQGSGVYQLQNGVCPFEAGDIFIFGTNRVHCITETAGENTTVLLNVQLEPRLLWSPFSNLPNENYQDVFNGKCEKLAFDGETTGFIRQKMLDIRREMQEKRPGYQIMLRALLFEVIGGLVRDSDDVFAERTVVQRERLLCLDRAVTYIHEHLETPMTLEEIAKYAGFSRTYFSTLFKTFNGLSPWEYITIRRVERSRVLLRSTSLSVLEVAQRSGFSNLSNFNRIFARTVGMSPRTYRNPKS